VPSLMLMRTAVRMIQVLLTTLIPVELVVVVV
jgi:hypothetical protein